MPSNFLGLQQRKKRHLDIISEVRGSAGNRDALSVQGGGMQCKREGASSVRNVIWTVLARWVATSSRFSRHQGCAECGGGKGGGGMQRKREGASSARNVIWTVLARWMVMSIIPSRAKPFQQAAMDALGGQGRRGLGCKALINKGLCKRNDGIRVLVAIAVQGASFGVVGGVSGEDCHS